MSTNNGGPTEMRSGDERDQLAPVKTPFTNAVLRGPEGTDDIRDLHCELAVDPVYRTPVTVSAWELDERQRELVAAGAHLRMSVWQHPIPPLSLAIEAPFCAGSGLAHDPVSMIYVKSERRFACPACEYRLQPLAEGSEPATAEEAERQVRGDFEPAPGDGTEG